MGWDVANTEAVEFAAWLGRSLPVTVQVMSSTQSKWTKSLANATKGRKKRMKEAQATFDSRVEKALTEHIPREQWSKDVSRLVDSKDRVRSLYETAKDFGADLILMGSRAKTPKGRFRPSSVADEMMRSCPVPLGLAPRGVKLSKKGITRVTYAIVAEDDPAEPEFSGLDYATALACKLGLPLRIIAFSPHRLREAHVYLERADAGHARPRPRLRVGTGGGGRAGRVRHLPRHQLRLGGEELEALH